MSKLAATTFAALDHLANFNDLVKSKGRWKVSSRKELTASVEKKDDLIFTPNVNR